MAILSPLLWEHGIKAFQAPADRPAHTTLTPTRLGDWHTVALGIQAYKLLPPLALALALALASASASAINDQLIR